MGTSGDISDLQFIAKKLEAIQVEERNYDDGHDLSAKGLYTALSSIMYERRTKMNPLWNSHVVGGCDEKGKLFLGYVDLLGTSYEASSIATGYGAYIAQPLLRRALDGRENVMEYEEALKVVEDCMRVLFYRDARSLNKIRVAVVDASGVRVSEPYSLQTDWSYASQIKGY